MPLAVLSRDHDAGLVGVFSGGRRRVDRHHHPLQRQRALLSASVQLVTVPQRTGCILKDFSEKLLAAEAGSLVFADDLFKKPGARFARFSYVDPRVTTTSRPSRANNSRMSLVGRGVVATRQRGLRPNLNPNCNMSQVSGRAQEPSSSHTAASCCGPRNRSGSSALNVVAIAPFGHVNRRFEDS
jgi:hypothetical protein